MLSMLFGIVVFSVFVSATNINGKEIDKYSLAKWAVENNYAIPNYDSGWLALDAKVNIGVCKWTRERDGRVFSGVYGKLSNGEKVCFSPSKKKVVISSVVAPVRIVGNITNSTII